MFMRSVKEMMMLYAVTDGSGEALRAKVEAALKGGVTIVQLREKNAGDEELLREAVVLKEICHEYSTGIFRKYGL